MVPFESYTNQNDVAILKLNAEKEFRIDLKALRFDFNQNGKTFISANSGGLLYFEHQRVKPEAQANPDGSTADPEALTTVEGAWDIEQHIDFKEAWSDNFGGHTDNAYGPQSIGMDISFVGAENVYGIPEHATDLALKTTKGEGAGYQEPYRLYNFDVFEYELDEPMALYGHVPMMIGHSAAHTGGIFWFNSAETYIDVTKSESSAWNLFGDSAAPTMNTHWFSETGIIDVFFFSGPKPKDIFRQFSSLVGTQELPPLFAIAYHQCRWNYQDEADVTGVNQKFEEHNLPYDVLWLDIEHTDGKRYFTWDGKAFPTSVRMLDDLEAYGRKMVTIVDPHIKRDSNYHIHNEATSGGHYIKDENNGDYEGHCWPGSSSWIDYMSPDTRKWWASKFSYDSYKGSTDSLYTWNDMNEPSVFNGPEVTMKKSAVHYKGWHHRDVHNQYGMMMHRATSEGLVQRNPGQNLRSFVLSRAFFAGTQRWGAIWTGDNTASWEHLEAAQPMLMSMGLAGIVFSGADVGGFFGNPEPDLLTRWYQAGAYQPFFRAHAHLDTKRREPWLIGDAHFGIVQEAIETRYHNLPYVYTAFYQAFRDNTPVMRPLWVEYPTDPETFKIQDSFLLGSDLLVTPAVKKGQTQTTAYLPAHPTDTWYDIDTHQKYDQKQKVTIDTPMDKILVFQRGGSIIPRKMRVRRSTVAMIKDPFTLYIAPNSIGEASGDLYLDDTATFDFKKGVYAYRQFTYKQSSNRAILRGTRADYPRLDESHNGGTWKQTEQKVERVVIMGISKQPVETFLKQDGKKVMLKTYFDQGKNTLTVKKPDTVVSEDWEIELLW